MSDEADIIGKGRDIMLPPEGNPFDKSAAAQGTRAGKAAFAPAVGAADAADAAMNAAEEPHDLGPEDVAAMFPSAHADRDTIPGARAVAGKIAIGGDGGDAIPAGAVPLAEAISIAASSSGAITAPAGDAGIPLTIGAGSPPQPAEASLGAPAAINFNAGPAADIQPPPRMGVPDDSAVGAPAAAATGAFAAAPALVEAAAPAAMDGGAAMAAPQQPNAPGFQPFNPFAPASSASGAPAAAPAAAPIASSPAASSARAAASASDAAGSASDAADSAASASTDAANALIATLSGSDAPFPPRRADVTEDDKLLGMLVTDDRINQLWQRIDSAERKVINDEDMNQDRREVSLDSIKTARNLMLGGRKNYEDAELYVGAVESELAQANRVRRWSYSYGIVILIYNVAWLVLLVFAYTLSSRVVSYFSDAGVVAEGFGLSVWVTILSGGLGGVSGALYSLWVHVSQRQDFDRQHIMWYITNPLMGAVLGIFVFMIAQAGVFTLSGGGTTSGNALFILYILAWIAGFQQNVAYQLVDRAIKTFLKPEEPAKPAAK